MVKDHPGGVELFGRATCRSRSGRESLPKVRKWSVTIPEVRNWSGDPPEVRNCSGDPPGGPEVVGRSSQTSGGGRETRPEVQKWSGDLS